VAQAEPLIRNISDAALLATVYRARETERQDARFRDPFARRLAGKRGDQIADSIPFSNRNAWAWVTSTYMFDQFIAEQCQQGVAMVVNLAAGLDTRPYRMALPPTLQWIEVDLSGILSYKVRAAPWRNLARRKARSSSFPTAGSRLKCVRHSKRRHVSNASHSACGCCLCDRSRTDVRAAPVVRHLLLCQTVNPRAVF
jgi:hypothetical protein